MLDPGISYFEYTISAEARLLKQKLVVSGEFRNTPDKEDDNFRQEFSIRGDYEVARYGKFHLSPMLGIMYQNYYKSFDYWFVHGGLFIRFH